MARIRTIKPEFFTSLTIASLTLEARLTFIGLWTHVDDAGRCVNDARLIKAALWPLDDRLTDDIVSDLGALTECSLIAQYEVRGRRYLAITNWTEHQRINRPTKSTLPGPEDPDAKPLTCENRSLTEHSVSPHGAVTEPSLGERKGKEGKGTKPLAPADANARKTQRPRDELWDTLMAACGIDTTAIPKSARGAYNTAVADLRHIGATPAQITLRAHRYRNLWPNASLTPTALARRWSELSDGAAKANTGSPNTPAPARDVLAALDRQVAADRADLSDLDFTRRVS